MNDDPCVVTVNNRDYYCPCDSVDYLIVADGYLINTSNTTVYLYSEYPDYTNNTSGYPRIVCRPNYKAYYQQNYSSNYSTISISSYDVVNRHISNSVLLMIVVIGVMVLNLFKR